MAASNLTAERVRELLEYNPETGIFTWRVNRGGNTIAGGIAGCLNDRGYVVFRVDGENQRAHRIAWLHFYGEWPTWHIDHKDGNRSHNAIHNLRDVPKSINQQNLKKAYSGSASGLLGVIAARGKHRPRASILVDGKRVNLGSFDTPEEAHAAYLAAKRRLHEGCTI